MSWMKRPQGSAATPRPEFQGYAAPQEYRNQHHMYPNYHGVPSVQQQQTWPTSQQQPQMNQQYGQGYQQQTYHNPTQFFPQQPQYNQNYTNQNMDNTQQGYPQNYYHAQVPQQQNFALNEGNSDNWEDNWGWGWEDAAKQHQKTISQVTSTQPIAQPIFNNTNVIEESFLPTNTWNWSMEEKKDTEDQSFLTENFQNKKEKIIEAANVVNKNLANFIDEPSSQTCVSSSSVQDNVNEHKSLNDKEIVKEHLPNLALGKRFHLENLTPQWSIESQMSQDSSDGPQSQSEGTYRSENQSRNSSKSSPGPNTDTSNFNYSLPGLNEMNVTKSEISKHPFEDSNISYNIQNNNRKEIYDEMAQSIKDMTISNQENMAIEENNSVESLRENRQSTIPSLPLASQINSVASNQFNQQNSLPTLPSVSTPHVPPNPAMLPILSCTTAPSIQPTLSPSNPTSTTIVPPSMPPPSMILHPSTNFQSTSSQNPFKSTGPFSHKNISKISNSNTQPQSLPVPVSGPILTSPGVVNKLTQHERLSTVFGANLETAPDNSERPDQPQATSYRGMPISQQVPDNLEIAPQHDRNEYLQTEHLSSGDYGENTNFSRNIPPPGLRRMGVGQQDVEYNENLNISGDEPPPGLARMVPGQQTEADNSYSQVGDNYMDRQIDGQPTDSSGRPYRQADGQPMPDNYIQSSSNRGSDRRPIGLDRMVPGEPALNDEYPQYQTSNFVGANEPRVVTGVDHDYPITTDAGPSDIREQNVDGSDYTDQTPRNAPRSIIGAREASNATSPDFSLSVDDQQREITMEGENLQDLSVVSSVDIQFAREPTYSGLSTHVESNKDRNNDTADISEYPINDSRRQSLSRVTSGEDSERDRVFKASPRKDRDKRKSSKDRDRDRERDKDRGRYSRSDRKYDRDSERRSGRDERRSETSRRDRDGRDWNIDRRDKSPEIRRNRRSTRSHRYETEDTDYYSDREREHRQHREGSYTSSKPPRDDDRSERRRYHAADRERRHEDERSRRGERQRARERPRDPERERFEHRYRDIDPRKYTTTLRKNRDEDERRKVVRFSGDAKSSRSSNEGEGEAYSSGSRAGSRDATATDEEGERPRRRQRDERRRQRHHRQYEGYGESGASAAWDEALAAQRRQYEYYERLRRSDPAAYMRIYKQLLDPALYSHGLYADGYGPVGYEARAERGSVHSGRSSANGFKPTDTELTTDMSLDLHLEESTVRSERMTPFKYSTTHVKGTLGAHALVLVTAGWPADGRAPPPTVLPLAQLLQRDPAAAELMAYPGPLVKGVTHKKSVVEYCSGRARSAGQTDEPDAAGSALLWELLALLLRQNGMVVGSDIAELLMKNAKDFEYQASWRADAGTRAECGRGSARLGSPEVQRDEAALADHGGGADALHAEEATAPATNEAEALDRLRQYLIYGNRQEALEWAMCCGLWGHALQLAAHGGRRERAAAGARFVESLGRADPLHSLYAALAQRTPPVATCVADEHWGDWRPHAAIVLSNPSSRPEQDRRTLTQLGDTLNARGLLYSAQFCYLSAGVPFAPHPLSPLRAPSQAPVAPPRLALLMTDSRATSLQRFATNQAIFATEIYEYALSLGQDYALDELTVYKLLLATRLADAGLCERALGYAEQAAKAVTSNPAHYSARIVAGVAALAERLKYYDPALQDEGCEEGASAGAMGEPEGGSEEASPRHQQWLRDVRALAQQLSADVSLDHTPHQHTPQHETPQQHTIQQHTTQQHTPQHAAENNGDSSYYGWGEHVMQQYPMPAQDVTAYAAQYHNYAQQPPQPEAQSEGGGEERVPSYPDPYWQNEPNYGYREGGSASGAGGDEYARPTITMPGSAAAKPSLFGDLDDDRSPSADRAAHDAHSTKTNDKTDAKGGDGKGEEKRGGKGGGWFGGILNKLSLRAPNQMILPDDTAPTIVWDAQRQRWRDTSAPEGDETGPGQPPAPPVPPALSTSTPLQSPGIPGAPPSAPISNIFKMQKGRHIKQSYVDVLNPRGAAAPAPRAPFAAPLGAPLAAPDNYFIPAPPSLSEQSSMYEQPLTSRDDEPRGAL